MKFQFIGETLPELAALPPKERRRLYYQAARRSYRDQKTALGLLVFIGAWIVAACSDSPTTQWVIFLAGCLFLLRMQMAAIRRQARLLLDEHI